MIDQRPASVPLLRLYVDGASRGNPGPAAGGIVLADERDEPLLERGVFLGRATNNVAEYKALLAGLELAASLAPQRLEIFADSELVVRQITGAYRVKSPDLLPLFEQAQQALLRFDNWQISHIPRSRNRRADKMANAALDRKGDVDEAPGESSAERAQGQADSPAAGPLVRVRVVLGADPRVCPAATMHGETFEFDLATPRGLCLYAASAVLPAALGLLAEPNVMDSPAGGPVTVACPRPGCDARFELTLVSE